ncbi:PH domain-containing protein [Candidatus Parcubacteria bacterium]|nr:PH domain-containing protein [Candidatus Parcubacteria bacterium]
MKQLHPRAVWLFLIGAIGRTIVIIIVAETMLLSIFSETNQNADTFFGQFVGTSIVVIIGLLILAFIYAKLKYHFYRYELTDHAFKKEHGIIWKKYVTIPYDRIQNVDVYRGLIARLLGLSDLQVQTAGGITVGSYGSFSEGRLPALSFEDAEKMRDELIMRARGSKHQGL